MRPTVQVRPLRRPLLLATLVLAAGCSRCGGSSAVPPERFVPASAVGALVIPDLGGAVRQAAALHGTLSALPGGEELGAARTSLKAQLGFDLLDPAALAEAGLDATRGAAVSDLALGPDGQAGQLLVVLPVADPAKLKALVTKVAADRLGATQLGQENANGRTFDVWRRALGEPALLSLAVAEGSALLAAGSDGPGVVRTALALDRGLSLEKSAAWQRARGVAGDGLAAVFFVPPGSPALAGTQITDGTVVGFAAGPRELKVVGAALLGVQEARLRPLAGPGPGSTRASVLDPATVVAIRLSASPAEALKLLADASGGQTPLDPVRKVAEALEPGVEIGLSLLPKAELGLAIGSRFGLHPLRVLRVEVLGTVKDPAGLAAVFDDLAKQAGGTATQNRWRIPLGNPERELELAWGLEGKTLALAAGPKGGLGELLVRAGGKGPGFTAPSKASGEALAGGLLGAVLSGDNLVAGVKALPLEAYGEGPDAVVGRSVVERLLTPAGRGGALSVRLDLPAGALRGTLLLELGEPPKAP